MSQPFPTSQGIQSLERGTRILEEVKNNESPLTLTELSQKVGMSKNSLKKYLVSFVNVGVLTFDEENKTYDLGAKLIEFGLNALNRFSIFSVIDPFMLKIKNEMNQSSALAIWTEKGPMITKYQSSGRSINVEIEVGYDPPLLGSSVGRCFAAFLPTQSTKDILEQEMADYHWDQQQVAQDLNDIKRSGFSSRHQHFGDLPGSHSVACPIFDYTGKMVAAICIIGFSDHFSTDAQSGDVQRLIEIAEQVSGRLAYQPQRG